MILRQAGDVIGTFPSQRAIEDFAAVEQLDLTAPDVQIELTPQEARAAARARIEAAAGDTQSLLGTTSDVAALALLHTMATITAEAEAGGDFAAFVAIKHGLLGQIAGDLDLPSLAAGFLSDVASGAVTIPIMAKGLDVALAEMAARSNAVSAALASQTPAAGDPNV